MSIKKNTQKYSPLLRQLAAMLVVCILLIFIINFFLKLYSRHGNEYEVPQIIGLTLADLATVPQSDYFEYVVIDSVFIPGKKGGEILTQDPPPNSKVKKGRKFYITVSSFNPENVSVPNLIDLTVRQAISQLDAVGLQGGKLTFIEDMARNAVLKQTFKGDVILPNEMVMRGSMIDLVVGKGESSLNTNVPLVIGKTPEEARRDILASSLNVGKEIYEDGIAKKSESRVYRQSPNYTRGNTVDLGLKVDLWYRSEKTTDFDKALKNIKLTPDTSSQVKDNVIDEDNW